MENRQSNIVPIKPVSEAGLPAPLQNEIILATENLKPADPKIAAVKLAQTLELWGVPKNWDDIAEFYLEAIEAMPLDVLEAVLHEARMTLKWLPKPSELRALAQEEMHTRINHLENAKARAKSWRDNLPPPIDIAERQRVGAKLGELRKTLGNGLKSPDCKTDNGKTPKIW